MKYSELIKGKEYYKVNKDIMFTIGFVDYKEKLFQGGIIQKLVFQKIEKARNCDDKEVEYLYFSYNEEKRNYEYRIEKEDFVDAPIFISFKEAKKCAYDYALKIYEMMIGKEQLEYIKNLEEF